MHNQLSDGHSPGGQNALNRHQRLGGVLLAAGLLLWLVGGMASYAALSASLRLGMWAAGTLLLLIGAYVLYRVLPVSNSAARNHRIFIAATTRPGSLFLWILTVMITGFYVILYWAPQYLHGFIALTDPFFLAVFGRSGMPENNGGQYNQWLLYGWLYTVAILIMGIRFLYKYRSSRYQQWRTVSVMLFQLVFAFLIPNLLASWHGIELYFHYFWPLDYDLLFPSSIAYLTNTGGWGHFFLWWSVLLAIPGVVALTYFFGKRWYCSWVCGCGGLAETAGDPFRHLSDKSLRAWQIERYSIHGVLAIITVLTVALLANQWFTFLPAGWEDGLQRGYGFLIGSVFSGVIGVGFYPILGSRVWCRFGCPQAAMLGILQKYFSRFRITTNGGQCISCGNCSTYCEMGIDVKWYAQREQNIVRASCVGCGVCAEVCPRGVLQLESGPIHQKTAIHIDQNGIHVLNSDQL